MSKRSRRSRSISLPQLSGAATKSESKSSKGGCGPRRPSTRGRWRASCLILIHVAFVLHLMHWYATGTTITPVEPSEAMQTLGQGLVNAGFILFVLLILSTLILGRFFCGWGCHIVALQDLCSWILKKIGLQPKPFRSRLLMFAPILAAVWMFVVPSLVRMYQGHPTPTLASHLTTQDFWARFPDWPVALLTFFVCGFAIVYLLGNKGFCTYGCPYGGVFGLVDKAAPGRIRVTDACEGCAHCTATCTSNVRVHEEVRLYGMVVNPGCMKCMDCISVCPKDALYFGFGAPAVVKGAPRAPSKRRKYDQSWKEEVALGLVYLVSVVIFTKLYEAIPLLLALGLAAISAFLLLCGARLFYRKNVSAAFFQLRRDGTITRAGVTLLAVAVLWTGLLVHSGVVRFLAFEGGRRLNKATVKYFAAGGTADAQTTREIKGAMSLLRSCEHLGLVQVPNLLGQLGSAASYIREHDQAEHYFRRAIQRAPKFAWAHYQLARYAQVKGQREEALDRLRAVIRLEPELGGALKDLVTLLVDMGRTGEAVWTLEDLRNRRPANTEFRATWVSLLSEIGELDRALVEARQLVADHPNLASAHFGLGAVLARQREFEAALSEFERTIELNPRFPEAYVFAARVLLLQKEWAEALPFIERARQLSPFNVDFARDWVELLMRLRRLEQEIATAERDMMSDRLARFNLMHLYKAVGRSDDAQRLAPEFSQAASPAPKIGIAPPFRHVD